MMDNNKKKVTKLNTNDNLIGLFLKFNIKLDKTLNTKLMKRKPKKCLPFVQ